MILDGMISLVIHFKYLTGRQMPYLIPNVKHRSSELYFEALNKKQGRQEQQ